jgi:ATP-dependent Lhr-like helicase
MVLPAALPDPALPMQHHFHPAVAAWFTRSFPAPTAAQSAAWPQIQSGRHTLVAAPTGSGKTLTAFLAAIDTLVQRGVSPEGLPDETVVVYVSPLKALSNDIQRNLEQPLQGIRAELAALGLPDVAIRTAVRTGDTPQRERAQALRRPPHILVTTPESLYVLLGSVSGRRMLGHVRTVIVDEIHALAADKRGSHLALTLERLQALGAQPLQAAEPTEAAAPDAPAVLSAPAAPAAPEAPAMPARPWRPIQRIGLSATQKPIEEVARFLVGTAAVQGGPGGMADCAIVDIGYAKERDLALVLPPQPLAAVMSNAQWDQVYRIVAQMAQSHRTTLVFVNTRRMAERAARHLGDLLGKEHVAAHHGSLAREARLDAEQRLKKGDLQLLVATASLELGLDIGDVDLVCQLGSPRSIATFLQRAGRSGHHVGGVPKARLFPQSRDELVECAALLDCVRRGELDALQILPAPLDVLAQQIVAETACREWEEDALYALCTRAWPYAQLTRADFDAVVRMLAEGFATRNGPRAAYVHRDGVHHLLRERKGARMTALTSGGTIPETGDYAVVQEPQALKIGTVHEDFAVESLAGDVFQLGNTSYRILRIELGRVRVEDAQGAAPNIPFWLGEAPGRSDELSFGVARLREEIAAQLAGARDDAGAGSGSSAGPGVERAIQWLRTTLGLDDEPARQLAEYLARAAAELGALPTQRHIVLERFFDESGGMQLVIHAPFGSRLNRAWGLALRKRFCRQFNFELQAAATEDAIILSLSTSHSFELASVARYLHSATALDVLVQALLDAPLFGVRWRWAATTALALPRFVGGTKVAPQLQRMKSEDLLASVFPDQVACAENLAGDREVPEHPLVRQVLRDCLADAMDAEGWLRLLRGMESGAITVAACDLTAPSALAAEVLTARPYAFLDDAPIEERRTQAVLNRRYVDPQSADDLGRLDADAIAAVRAEAWPTPRHPDEMHEALTSLGVVTDAEAAAQPHWPGWLAALARDGRATLLRPGGEGAAPGLWVAAERLPLLRPLYPGASLAPALEVPDTQGPGAHSDDGARLCELLRARMGGLGPCTVAQLAGALGLAPAAIDTALLALQTEGAVLQGRFTPGAPTQEWCERHLLARIHRYTLGRLRREIEPLEPRDFARFLFAWQRLGADQVSGPEALAAVLAQLEGYEAPAAAWESELLPARVSDYAPHWLDEQCTAGRVMWARLRPPAGEVRGVDRGGTGGGVGGGGGGGGGVGGGAGSPSLRSTPIVLLPRRAAGLWRALAPAVADDASLGHRARRVAEVLWSQGASFFDEISDATRLLRTEVEDALGELVARGRVHCDSFAGLRALLVPPSRRAGTSSQRRRGIALSGVADAGRWSLVRPVPAGGAEPAPAAAPRTPAAAPIRGGEAGLATLSAPAAPAAPAGPGAPAGQAAPAPEVLDQVARILLRRYGVVCWHLMEREAAWLPPWRDLVRVYRRLEARGEVRGGRFIAGLSGEQFALPEAIAPMRQVRRQPPEGRWVCLAAADPGNLLGSVLPGAKLPRVPGARVLFRDGVPVATLTGGGTADQVRWLEALAPALQQAGATMLVRGVGWHAVSAPGMSA